MEAEAFNSSSFINHSEYRISDVSGSPVEVMELDKQQMAKNRIERRSTGAPESPAQCLWSAAMKVQKVYRSYRTRRMLADSAVFEELWWRAVDFARLNHSTISFYNFVKPETAASRWNRVSLNASRVGKGLSKHAKAQQLTFDHWIEAIDPRHRYGHSLHFYFDEWCKANSGQPFFYWLDLGDGKEVDLEECPRSNLRQQCINYLGPRERERYEFLVVDGTILHKLTGKPLDTNQPSPGSKWIFVMSPSKRLYIGGKKKGLFHHSSFLAGGAILAAGILVAEDGVLKSILGHSGHYKPTDDSLDGFLSFLKENGVNLNEVEIFHPGSKTEFKRTFSGGLQSPETDVPKGAILQRIKSKKSAESYQLGHQLSAKWSTGDGPIIGCVADCPLELRLQVLVLTNLSPHSRPPSSIPRRIDALVSPSDCSSNLSNDELLSLNL